MTLERILSAAVNAMVKGHHVPHCYSAHVPGQGYVNRGEVPHNRADYLRQLEQSAKSESENMGFAPDYAEPGYDSPRKGILFANWNIFPRDFDRVLERVGYAVEWSDEWATCEDCNRAVRTSPDSMCWAPVYSFVDGCTILCRDCLQEAYPTSADVEDL